MKQGTVGGYGDEKLGCTGGGCKAQFYCKGIYYSRKV